MKHIEERREILCSLGLTLLWNGGVYYGARLLTGARLHHDMTTALDERIPFLPWTISIYWGCYLFWCVNYCLCAVQAREERERFFCADLLAKGFCFLLFMAFPTTNIRPAIVGTGIWENLMRLLYRIDAADNLFPSIHCLVSWLCWIGVRKRQNIPRWYRGFSLIAAMAVCLSTLTTKQHVLADVFGGIGLAEVCYALTKQPKLRDAYSVVIAQVTRAGRT